MTTLTSALLSASAALTVLALAPVCGAQPFSEPPDGQPAIAHSPDDGYYDQPHYYEPPSDDYLPRSTVRIHTGPALRINDGDPAGGLFVALDIGEKAAGLRASGAWVKVGAEGGLSQYAGELWIDFGYDRRLHPILGAGAGLAHMDLSDPTTGELTTQNMGVGILRGSLEYVLPVRGTDARASLDVMGAVPAIRSESASDVSPWLLAVASVGVGF